MRLVSTLLAVAVLAASPAAADDRPRVLATVGMIADVATEVGGTCVVVETLMGPGTDPHLYQPSAGDVRAFLTADAVFHAGHHLEGRLGAVLEGMTGRKPVVAVAEEAAPADTLIQAEGAPYPDPHLWMDVSIWAGTVEPIRRTLAELAPGCAEAMAARAAAYRAELDALHQWIGATLATIPEGRRVLVTAHDAFAYYGRAYGIEVAGIQGISTDAEAGIADIRAVVDLVIARDVPAVFVESTINPRTVRAVIEAAAARDHALALGAELFSDAMGAAGTPEGTYIGMLHANTRAIASALGGAAAPTPPALAARVEGWRIGG